MFSGGASSFVAATLVVWRYGWQDVTLLAADTGNEDADNWRFAQEASALLRVPLTIVRDPKGGDIWDTFERASFIGNTRADICSRVKKREPLRDWLERRCTPADSVVYLGFDWTEANRIERARPFWAPWRVEFPLDGTWGPTTSFAYDTKAAVRDAGLAPPRLYAEGFEHANCGGACVKAGQGQWIKLLEMRPETFAYHELREAEFNARRVGKPTVAILRDRRDAALRPYLLSELRADHVAGRAGQLGMFEDDAACSCFDSDDVVAKREELPPAVVGINSKKAPHLDQR